MSTITWQPVDDVGDQKGTCAEGTFLVRGPDAGHQVQVAFRPNLPEGETLYSLNDSLEAHQDWSPESNRLAAMHPFLPGSILGRFHDRDSAPVHLEWILTQPIPAESVEDQLAAAGFIKDLDGSTSYSKYVGTSTFELGVTEEGVGLRVFKSLTRWRNLISLTLPYRQHTPLKSVGVWPGQQGDARFLVAAAIMITEWAIMNGLTSAPRRPSARKRG
jgi:hypothetical protein